MLKDNGATDLRFAAGGAEAFQILKATPSQVVITDWHMPRMTGIELLQAVRNDPDVFKTQVLIISSESSPLWVLHAVEEGADGFLLKPFTEENLLQSILEMRQKQSDPRKRRIDEVTRLKLLGLYQEAIDLGEQMLEEADSAELSYEVAECHYLGGQYDEALQRAERALEGSRDGKKMGLLARIHLETGCFDEAIAILEEAVKKNPMNFSRKMDLLSAFSNAGRTDQAEGLLDSIDTSQLTDMNLVDLARYYLQSGDSDRAGEYLKQAREPLPSAAKVYNGCASILWNKGARDKSILLYRRCIKISPDYAMGYYNLGLAYCLNESYQEAEEVLKTAIRLKPDYKRARDVLEYVKAKTTPRDR